MSLEQRLTELANDGAALAFSGGVDSALLLALLSGSGRVVAVTFSTPWQPGQDTAEAARLAAQLGARHRVIEVDLGADPRLQYNPRNRCYLCKLALFSELRRFAESEHLPRLIDGTNADDLTEHRPGLVALRELGVISPLAEFGIGKEEVRRRARELGLAACDRPAAPCLATRFPYGTELTVELLRRAELGEAFLRELGFAALRLRLHGEVARIELASPDLAEAVRQREKITAGLKSLGCKYVTLDLEGLRSGSMDE